MEVILRIMVQLLSSGSINGPGLESNFGTLYFNSVTVQFLSNMMGYADEKVAEMLYGACLRCHVYLFIAFSNSLKHFLQFNSY